MDNKGQMVKQTSDSKEIGHIDFERIVLEKGVFSSIFEKDIRRVYIYKKSERIAKALHMVTPAFKDAKALRDRIQRISIEIVDASILPPNEAKDALARELLSLSSVLSMARTAGILSPMNADIIMREAHNLLSEVAAYEDPRVALPDVLSIAALAKSVPGKDPSPVREIRNKEESGEQKSKGQTYKGQNKPTKDKNGRREAILSILASKGPSYIKDLSTLIREVSEKTIQRELQALVQSGRVQRTGERRWTMYALTGSSSQKGQENEVVIDETAVMG